MGLFEYRAAHQLATAFPDSVVPFFELKHAGTKQVRVLEVRCAAPTLASAGMLSIACGLYSTVITGGTPVGMTETGIDPQAPAATATAQMFSAVGSAGTLLGDIGIRRIAAAADGAPLGQPADAVFTFGPAGLILPTATHAIALRFAVAPGVTSNIACEATWVEEG